MPELRRHQPCSSSLLWAQSKHTQRPGVRFTLRLQEAYYAELPGHAEFKHSRNKSTLAPPTSMSGSSLTWEALMKWKSRGQQGVAVWWGSKRTPINMSIIQGIRTSPTVFWGLHLHFALMYTLASSFLVPPSYLHFLTRSVNK